MVLNSRLIFYKSEVPESPAVLILPGISGRHDPYNNFSKKLNKAGFSVLSVNYYKLDRVSKKAKHKDKKRALEKRGGTLGLVENEVTTALNFLWSQDNVDKNRIGIIGTSLGTWTGLQRCENDHWNADTSGTNNRLYLPNISVL